MLIDDAGCNNTHCFAINMPSICGLIFAMRTARSEQHALISYYGLWAQTIAQLRSGRQIMTAY